MRPGQRLMLPRRPASVLSGDARPPISERSGHGSPAGSAPRTGRRRWPWIGLGLFGAFGKTQGLATGWRFVYHHPHLAVALLPILAAWLLVRGKPIGMALLLAPLAAVLIDPRSVLGGIAIAAGSFLVLLTVCLLIGTALRWRDELHSSAR